MTDVFETGRASMDVRVTVHAERPEAGERRDTATSFFTFVALDADEEPTEVPRLDCPDERQRALRDRALEQRSERRRTLAER